MRNPEILVGFVVLDALRWDCSEPGQIAIIFENSNSLLKLKYVLSNPTNEGRKRQNRSMAGFFRYVGRLL